MAEHADIICGQELNKDNDRMLARIPGWSEFQSDRPEPGANSIHWRTDRFRLRNKFVIEAYDHGHKVEPGAGPETASAKSVTGVVLLDTQSAEEIVVLNLHAIASAMPRRNKRRRELHHRHMRKAASLATRWAGKAWVLCGDFNATPHHSLMQPLRREGLVCNFDALRKQLRWTFPKHEQNIDQQWTRGHQLVFTDHDLVEGLRTDHNALVVTYEWRS